MLVSISYAASLIAARCWIAAIRGAPAWLLIGASRAICVAFLRNRRLVSIRHAREHGNLQMTKPDGGSVSSSGLVWQTSYPLHATSRQSWPRRLQSYA